MNRLIPVALAAVALGVAGLPATAAEKKPEAKGDVGQYVDLQPVGLPIVSNGKLVNYVFVYVRVNLTSAANVSRLREKEPNFRDALVRAGHRTPFNSPNDFAKVDTPRLIATLSREAAIITGPGQIRSIVVTSQEPRRRMVAPRV